MWIHFQCTVRVIKESNERPEKDWLKWELQLGEVWSQYLTVGLTVPLLGLCEVLIKYGWCLELGQVGLSKQHKEPGRTIVPPTPQPVSLAVSGSFPKFQIICRAYFLYSLIGRPSHSFDFSLCQAVWPAFSFMYRSFVAVSSNPAAALFISLSLSLMQLLSPSM